MVNRRTHPNRCHSRSLFASSTSRYVLIQGLIIFGFGFLGVVIAASAAIFYRKSLIKILVFSLINLSLYLLVCTIMLAVPCKKLIIPTSIYSNFYSTQLQFKPSALFYSSAIAPNSWPSSYSWSSCWSSFSN